MTNTFLTDENVYGPAIEQARSRGVSIVTAAEANLLKTDDLIIFEYAAQRDYVVVTGNIKHYALLLVEWYKTHDRHPGILYIKPEHQKNGNLIANALIEFSSQLLTNRIGWI